MSMTPQLFSISAAAVELGADRRTIAAALSDIPPDGELRGHPAWKLRSILAALEGNGAVSGDLAEAERLGDVLLQGILRIEAERSIEKRRKLFEKFAPNFGRLNNTLSRMNGTLPDHERDLLENYQQMIMGRLLGRSLALCNLKIAKESGSKQIQ